MEELIAKLQASLGNHLYIYTIPQEDAMPLPIDGYSNVFDGQWYGASEVAVELPGWDLVCEPVAQ